MNVDQAWSITAGFEGRGTFTQDPNDPGKGTKWGISSAAYPKLDIPNLDEATAKGVFITDFWNASGAPKLKPELQFVHVDTAFNCGVVTAIEILQECAKCTIDGKFGPETMMKSDNVNIERYLFYREMYDAKIVSHRQSQIEYLGGWSARNEKILELYDAGTLK